MHGSRTRPSHAAGCRTMLGVGTSSAATSMSVHEPATRPGVSPKEFQAYWHDVHAPLVLKLPGVQRYVQSRPVVIPGKDPPYDGMAEVWYDDIESLRATIGSQACEDVLADEVNFMGRATE